MLSLEDDAVEEDERDAEQVESTLVDQVLTIDELSLPLGLDQDKGHHDQTSCKQQDCPEEGSLSDQAEDDNREEDSPYDKGKWVHHSHVMGMILS